MASISFSQFLYNSIIGEAHMETFTSPVTTLYNGVTGAVTAFDAPADWVIGSTNGTISTPSGPYSSVVTIPTYGQYFTVALDEGSSTGFTATLSNAPFANLDSTSGLPVATSIVFTYK